ncbi:MAG: glucose-6-phosphate isomerase, partial [Verrucomicrobiota bacterium]
MPWSRFKTHFYHNSDLAVSLDVSRIPFPDDFLATMEARMQDAFAAMKHLESGAIANPDEQRMVGHYWLRAPHLAPSPDLAGEITSTLAAIKDFAAKIHSGAVAGPKGKFKNLLVIGIGGSALGPQFVAHALGQPRKDRLAVAFFDNTDPDGIDYVLNGLRGQLAKTLVVVISKSGGTAETRNGMLE